MSWNEFWDATFWQVITATNIVLVLIGVALDRLDVATINFLVAFFSFTIYKFNVIERKVEG